MQFSGWRGQPLYDVLLAIHSQESAGPSSVAKHLEGELQKAFMRFIYRPKMDIAQDPDALMMFNDMLAQARERGPKGFSLDQYDPRHSTFKFKELMLPPPRPMAVASALSQDVFNPSRALSIRTTRTMRTTGTLLGRGNSTIPAFSEIGMDDSVWNFFDDPLPFSQSGSDRALSPNLENEERITPEPDVRASVPAPEASTAEKRKAVVLSDEENERSSVVSVSSKSDNAMASPRQSKRSRGNRAREASPFVSKEEPVANHDLNAKPSHSELLAKLEKISRRKPKNDYEKQALRQLMNPEVREFIASVAFVKKSVKELVQGSSLNVNDVKFAIPYCNQKTDIQIGIPATNIHNDRFMELHKNGSPRPVRELVDNYLANNPGANLSYSTIQNKVAEHNAQFPGKRIGPPVGWTGSMNLANHQFKPPKHKEYEQFMTFIQSPEAKECGSHNQLYLAYKRKHPKTSLTRFSPYDWVTRDSETGLWKKKESRQR